MALLDLALEEVAGREYEFSVARLYARGIRAHADLAEQARAGGDEEAGARAESAAAATLDRFSALLDPGRYPEGEATPMACAYESIGRAELTRAAGSPDPGAWADAAARMAELDMELERAYATWRQAEAIVATEGDRAEAAEVVAVAAAVAAASGATGLLDQVTAFARRARLPLQAESGVATEGGLARDGERPADPALERFGLTRRELEVLTLVADGRTNREIGESLFIAEKTASVHVSRILGKLGVRSRVEAATAAHKLGVPAGDGDSGATAGR